MDRTRLTFNFDDPSLESLERLTREAGFPTMGATMHAAIQLIDEIRRHAADGCSEVILRNPGTGSSHHLRLDPRTLQAVR
jgi:hypothetical protein